MPRAVLLALLVVCLVHSSLQAQRAGATLHSSSAYRSPVRSGFVGQRGSNRFSPRHSALRRESSVFDFAPYYLPLEESFGDAQPDAEGVPEGPLPPVVILQSSERQSREPEPRASKPLVIEIPGVANSRATKVSPPTLFILATGERLETRRFVLTASALSVSIDRQQRTIPLDMLDLEATSIANRERGIDLRIPADRTEISLSF
jgi:hypothetical protein